MYTLAIILFHVLKLSSAGTLLTLAPVEVVIKHHPLPVLAAPIFGYTYALSPTAVHLYTPGAAVAAREVPVVIGKDLHLPVYTGDDHHVPLVVGRDLHVPVGLPVVPGKDVPVVGGKDIPLVVEKGLHVPVLTKRLIPDTDVPVKKDEDVKDDLKTEEVKEKVKKVQKEK